MSYWDGQRWADEQAPMPSQPSRAKRRFAHVGQAVLEGTLIATLAVGLIASSALAAKGGRHASNSTNGSSISLVVLNSSDGLAHYGDKIRFDISTSASYPIVNVDCSQSGVRVYAASLPYYTPNIWDSDGTFTLSSTAWTGGAADCTAALRAQPHKRIVTLATTSFHVEP